MSGAGIGGSWDWRTAEASLYCIRAIAKAVPSSEDVLLPQVVNTENVESTFLASLMSCLFLILVWVSSLAFYQISHRAPQKRFVHLVNYRTI